MEERNTGALALALILGLMLTITLITNTIEKQHTDPVWFWEELNIGKH